MGDQRGVISGHQIEKKKNPKNFSEKKAQELEWNSASPPSTNTCKIRKPGKHELPKLRDKAGETARGFRREVKDRAQSQLCGRPVNLRPRSKQVGKGLHGRGTRQMVKPVPFMPQGDGTEESQS